jgi:hypothetical protein
MAKSPILLSQYWKDYHFQRVTKIISNFDGSNTVFVDCRRKVLTVESPVLAQALNFRLPQLPRKLPSLPSNYTINIYAVQGR